MVSAAGSRRDEKVVSSPRPSLLRFSAFGIVLFRSLTNTLFAKMLSSSLFTFVALSQLTSFAWGRPGGQGSGNQTEDFCMLPNTPCHAISSIQDACKIPINAGDPEPDPKEEQKCICDKGFFDQFAG